MSTLDLETLLMVAATLGSSEAGDREGHADQGRGSGCRSGRTDLAVG